MLIRLCTEVQVIAAQFLGPTTCSCLHTTGTRARLRDRTSVVPCCPMHCYTRTALVALNAGHNGGARAVGSEQTR